jgi:hypothetical protein
MEQKRVLTVNSILGRCPRRNLPLEGALRAIRLAGGHGHRGVKNWLLASIRRVVAWSRSVY